jgi:hypothetical protein
MGQYKPHRSASALSSYYTCGEYYRRTYVENDWPAPALSMHTGKATHRAIEANFVQKIKSRQDMPAGELVALALGYFDDLMYSEPPELTPDEKAAGAATIDAAKGKISQWVAAHVALQAPSYQPIAVEQKVRIPVPRGTHDILGVLDLVATTRTGKRAVRDFKTGGKKKVATEAADSVQLTIYAAGHQVEYGFPADEVGLDVLVVGSKGATSQELTDGRDAADFNALANRLNMMEQGIKAGVFLPAPAGSWKCSDAYCPFFRDRSCQYVNADRIAAAKAAEKQNDNAD